MEVTIRLYRQYDIDLIYLAHYEDFSMVKTAKACIKAFAEHKAFRINFPEGQRSIGSEDKTVYEYKFSFDYEKDPEAIRLLRSVRSRHKNSFIKNLIRGYMVAPFTLAYLDDEKMIEDGTDSFERMVRSSDTVPSFPKKKIAQSSKSNNGDNARKPEKEQKADVFEKTARKKKKNAVASLGELLLAPRKDDEDILPAPKTSIIPDPVKIDEPEPTTLKSVLFPQANVVVDLEQKIQNPVVSQTAQNEESTSNQEEDIMDAISSLVTEY